MAGTITPGQSESVSNRNEEVLNNSQSSKTRFSSSDAIYWRSQDSPFLRESTPQFAYSKSRQQDRRNRGEEGMWKAT